jgi:tripeptide aminopeptidase
MKTAEHPELLAYVGQDIVVSDGTSVLGADNKAAVANVMTALSTLSKKQGMYHGDIYVAFVPDEECGLYGSKSMNFSKFPVDFAYTIDSCALGEVVYETFNAGSAEVTIHGVSAHPMSAKGVLVNPTLIAVDFINLFDRRETPECTEGKEGYIWCQSVVSNQSTATVHLKIMIKKSMKIKRNAS